MSKILSKRLMFLLYYLVSALFFEVVTFRILGLGIFPKYFGYDLAIILSIAFLIFAIPNYTAQYISYTILLGLQVIFIYTNYSLLAIYGDLFSLDMFAYIGEATMAITTSFVYFAVIAQLVGAFVLDLLLGVFILKWAKKENINTGKHVAIILSLIMILLDCASCGYVILKRQVMWDNSDISDMNYIESDGFLLRTSIMKASSYENFGTFGYFVNMLVGKVSNVEEDMQNRAVDFFKSGSIYGEGDNISRIVDDEGRVIANLTGIDSGNNVIMIMMESTEWFAFGDGNYDSEFDNMSRELTPNIYYLMYGEDDILSEDNLADNGIRYTNYFAKSKTNFSEGIGLIGQYPVGRVLEDITSKKFNNSEVLNYALPSVLRNNNYYTSYIHSNASTFYSRNTTHKYLGFDNVIGKEYILDDDGNQVYTGKDLTWGHWEEEKVIVEETMDYIVPSEEVLNGRPFFSFYLNVSSHGPYKPTEYRADYIKYKELVMYGEDNCELVDNVYKLKEGLDSSESYSTWYSNILNRFSATDPKLIPMLLCYESSVVGLDRAIGAIIDKLQTTTYTTGPKAGQTLFDNTTLVLYADHYAFYDEISNKMKDFEENDVSSIELQTIPMIISSPGIRRLNSNLLDTGNDGYCIVEDKDFHTHYDLLPTILDMLGISYNENFYLGSSVFARSRTGDRYDIDGETHEMKLYYSNTGGIFGEDIYTYDMKNFVYDRIEIDEAELELFKTEAKKILIKINYLDIINRYGLYYRCVE